MTEAPPTHSKRKHHHHRSLTSGATAQQQQQNSESELRHRNTTWPKHEYKRYNKRVQNTNRTSNGFAVGADAAARPDSGYSTTERDKPLHVHTFEVNGTVDRRYRRKSTHCTANGNKKALNGKYRRCHSCKLMSRTYTPVNSANNSDADSLKSPKNVFINKPPPSSAPIWTNITAWFRRHIMACVQGAH